VGDYPRPCPASCPPKSSWCKRLQFALAAIFHLQGDLQNTLWPSFLSSVAKRNGCSGRGCFPSRCSQSHLTNYLPIRRRTRQSYSKTPPTFLPVLNNLIPPPPNTGFPFFRLFLFPPSRCFFALDFRYLGILDFPAGPFGSPGVTKSSTP